MSEMRLTHLDLCSGTGAATIAFDAEGFETVGFSEIDPFCCRLLKHHWPNIHNYGDIRNVPALKCNVISAGDPCQPFSVAGRRKGEADDRYIWPSVLAVVERCKPDFFLGENVVGIANMVLSRRIDDLEAQGYKCKAFDIPSCAIGLPSVERHIWLVAASGKLRLEGSEKKKLPNITEQREVFRIGGQIQSDASRERIRWHLSPSRNLRSIKGIPNYLDRIASIGNAFPPPICQIFAAAIREFLTLNHVAA